MTRDDIDFFLAQAETFDSGEKFKIFEEFVNAAFDDQVKNAMNKIKCGMVVADIAWDGDQMVAIYLAHEVYDHEVNDDVLEPTEKWLELRVGGALE